MHTQLREKLGKEIRNELRHEKLNKIRKQIDNRNEELEYPLISDVLQDFWQLSHRQIAESLDVIRETVERSNIECLDEAEHNSLVVDLLYLVVEHQFELPVGLPLRKDESQMTAVLVSMTQGHTVEQLLYWVQYMGEQELEMLFSQISADDPQHLIWINESRLFTILIKQSRSLENAAIALKELLAQSSQLTLQCAEAIRMQTIVNISDKLCLFPGIFLEMVVKMISIYGQMAGKQKQTVQLINVLNLVIDEERTAISLDLLSLLAHSMDACGCCLFYDDRMVTKFVSACLRERDDLSKRNQGQCAKLLNLYIKEVSSRYRSYQILNNPMYKPSNQLLQVVASDESTPLWPIDLEVNRLQPTREL